MGITATGVGSGLDIDGLVTQLMAAERAPMDRRLLRRDSNITSDISALGSLKSALSDFKTSLASVNSLSTYQQRNVTSSNTDALTVGAYASAALGNYSVSVEGLAAAQSVAVRSTFIAPSSEVGTGTLTFTFGTTGYTPDTGNPANNANDSYDSFVAKAGVSTKTVTISSADRSLSGVRDAINRADIGVSAAIVNDGTGYRLVMTSDATGAENSVEISVTDTGDSNNTDNIGLSRLAFNSSVGTTNAYQTVAAADAAFTVNGLSLSSDSNIVANALDGLTVTLKQKTTTAASLTVTDNAAGIKAAITSFVGGYNAFNAAVTSLTKFDTSSGVSGALQGDFTARSIIGQTQATLGAAALGFDGALSRLAEIGITTTNTGDLKVNDTKLDAALTSSHDDVAGVLTRFADLPAQSGLSSVTFTDAVERGTYAVKITSLATSGTIADTVASAGFPKTINSSNNDFQMTVDGTASGTITLTSQAYANLGVLATEMQTRINADATLRAAGKSVTVSVSGDDLEIRSNSVGSTSTLQITNSGGDSTITTLGLDSPTTTNGTDLVGTIAGVAGVAEGNVLTGAASSNAAGITVEVSSTTGGNITISDGVVDQIDTLLATFLATDNTIDTRIGRLQKNADDIVDERAALELRLDSIEARYRMQFNALDTLLNQISSTGAMVTEQLANIPIPGQTKK
jgi:flagellar hook-associated protein 2